jgi:hypothetical protein
MAARTKKRQNSLVPLLTVLLVVLAGYFLLSTKSSTNSPSSNVTVSNQPVKPVATKTQNAVSQNATSGPVGRNALRAYAGPGVGEVTLEWQRFYIDGENYNVRYGTTSKSYPYGTMHIGYISTYTVKGLTPGTKYYFVVEGLRAGNVSAGWDGEVSMVAPGSPTVVVDTAGPVGRNQLVAKPGPKPGQVTLNWTRYFPDTEKYHIIYGITPGKYIYGMLNAIDTTPQDNNYSVVISALNSGTRYYFSIEPQRNGTAIYAAAEVSQVAP